MTRRRPLVAVTTSTRSGWRIFPLVAFNLWLAGGRGERWGVGRPSDLDRVDGLIIGGGDDIGPELYGQGLFDVTARIDPDRDQLESSLARIALRRGVPVLGICRGAQMLNIALGGTLDQDAWNAFEYEDGNGLIKTVLPKRDVLVTPGSRLAQIAGEAPMRVNALHTQAVDKVGRGLAIVARDRAGMPQAVERREDPFALGVQWHPEHLFYARRQRAIFRAIVTAARAYAESRNQVGAVSDDAMAAE
ncbi:MAG: gamma-glutamyl-gamma-aminobutyrate hydrolase family protein [Shimia sp.]